MILGIRFEAAKGKDKLFLTSPKSGAIKIEWKT